MKKSLEHQRRSTFRSQPLIERRCTLHNLQLRLAGFEESHHPTLKVSASRRSQLFKENREPESSKLLLVPASKRRSSDRVLNEAKASAGNFKDFMRTINFFNIKPLVLERRPSEEASSSNKKMLIITGSSPKPIIRKSIKSRER